MNVIEAWDDFTSSEKLMFQNCCRKILRRTFLVRDKQKIGNIIFLLSII